MFDDGPVWIDPPRGDEYGFPKVYNKETDGDFKEWMLSEEYPEDLLNFYWPNMFIRSWKKEPS